MRNVKFVAAFAVCGFLLSFVFGLFSHSSILSILFKAFVFSLCFALLGFGIDFVFSHFLDDQGSTSEFGGDTVSVSAPASSNGRMVDITIQDEELPPGESQNRFIVGENHQMLNDSDLKRSGSVAVHSTREHEPEKNDSEMPKSENAVQSENANASDNGFVPIKPKETFQNVSGKEAVASAEVQSVSTGASSSGSKDDELDILPDMSNFALDSPSHSGSNDDVGTEEEFVSSSRAGKGDGEGAEIKDAALMAKAISSVLSDDNS